MLAQGLVRVLVLIPDGGGSIRCLGDVGDLQDKVDNHDVVDPLERHKPEEGVINGSVWDRPPLIRRQSRLPMTCVSPLSLASLHTISTVTVSACLVRTHVVGLS